MLGGDVNVAAINYGLPAIPSGVKTASYPNFIHQRLISLWKVIIPSWWITF
jgi:hypothetical protein